MHRKQYTLVEMSILPDVFKKVLRAKELLASGEAKNVSTATRMADVSRSAFYKYKDNVFYADSTRGLITLKAILKDETGALQALLAGISQVGGSVATINQFAPENGAAQVTVTVRTEGMQMTPDELCAELQKQRTIVEIRRQ